MVYFSNAPETSNLFGSYIEQVQQVLAANHVQFGSPADFPAFTETLETDSQLRNDLASLARSFMGGEEHVSLRTVLSIIAIASGGPDVADSDSDMSQPVSVLVDFLISSGGGRPAGTEVPDSHQSDPINASPYQTELSSNRIIQPSPIRKNHNRIFPLHRPSIAIRPGTRRPPTKQRRPKYARPHSQTPFHIQFQTPSQSQFKSQSTIPPT